MPISDNDTAGTFVRRSFRTIKIAKVTVRGDNSSPARKLQSGDLVVVYPKTQE